MVGSVQGPRRYSEGCFVGGLINLLERFSLKGFFVFNTNPHPFPSLGMFGKDFLSSDSKG
jgi:hypothetical protein